MSTLVYDEWYGTLTYAQRACYRKHNVPPAMHDDLVAAFGNDHDAIVRFVKATVARKGRIDYGDVDALPIEYERVTTLRRVTR